MTGAALWIWFQQIFGPASRRGEEILAFYGHPGGAVGDVHSRQLREDGKLTLGEIHRLVPKVEAEAGRIASLCRERGYGILTPGRPGLSPPAAPYSAAAPGAVCPGGAGGD